MKKLHRLVFQTFLGPFIITLVISNFLLLMIWMVKYLEDIIGKGLEFSIILEMMGRGALNQIPFSLPLAMLLSSTMTFGKLGETVELIAMKSLGISLQKAMNPLLAFAVMITIGAFFFTNNYLPYSNKKLKALVSDIRVSKPELLIPEGVFYNQLRGYTVRIGKKYEDKSIADVLIFDDSNTGMDGFIAADSGNMALSSSGEFLILNLINGNTYRRDREKVKPGKKKKIPYVRNKFKTNQILFDLSGFKFEKTDPSNRGKSTRDMNITELSQGIDSLNNKRLDRLISTRNDLDHKYFFRPDTTFQYDTLKSIKYNRDSIITLIKDSNKLKNLYRSGLNLARNSKNYISRIETTLDNNDKFIVSHQTEWHKKFSMAFACIVMFFIGAPFGAIVRKGGLGLPVVIGILLFLFYYVTSTTMGKMAKKGDINPVLGMWIAPLILSPVGLFLTYKATTDSNLFRWEAYKKTFKKMSFRK